MKVALLITAFNRPEALNLVLKTVAYQSRPPDEVVVCDDGSTVETRMLVRQWEGLLPIRHAWQPDRDFRAARSRNLGACKSNTEYLVWIDGDCMLPPQFVENHLKLAKSGRLVAGGRYLLSKLETQGLLDGALPITSAFSHWKFRSLCLGVLRDLHPGAWDTVRTCNVGMHRDSLLAIGGFDESYVGWGREDSDFVVRLIHKKTTVRSGRLSTCVAHLWHHEVSRNRLSVNDKFLQDTLTNESHILAKSSVLKSL